MTGKRKLTGRTKILRTKALDGKRSQAVKGGFLGKLIKKAGTVVK